MKPNEKDPFLNLKYIAYCIAYMPDEHASFLDFVRFCKFQLCLKNNILMENPIWEKYTNEEIIVEYYATKYALDKDAKEAFQRQLNGEKIEEDDMFDWMDSEIEKNKKELTEKFGNKKTENISFKPVIGE